MKRYILTIVTLLLVQVAMPQTPHAIPKNVRTDSYRMKSFVDGLMKKMTLQEKLGQLNLPGAGDITTGGQAGEDKSALAKKIKEGKVGGLFNIKGVQKIRYVQQIAMEQSRLKIP